MGGGVARRGKEHKRVPLRGVVGGGGGFNIQTVNVLPAIPTRKTIIFLESVDAAQLPTVVPKPDAKDAYWWAVPNDDRWHPIGGKLVDMVGLPGDVSGV